MSTKHPSINPDDIKITPADSLTEMAVKAGIKAGLRHAQEAEDKAKQPSGLDGLGAEDYDPNKSR